MHITANFFRELQTKIRKKLPAMSAVDSETADPRSARTVGVMVKVFVASVLMTSVRCRNVM